MAREQDVAKYRKELFQASLSIDDRWLYSLFCDTINRVMDQWLSTAFSFPGLGTPTYWR